VYFLPVQFDSKRFLLILVSLTLGVSLSAAGVSIWLDRGETRRAFEQRQASLAELQENQTIAWLRVAELILAQMEQAVAGRNVEQLGSPEAERLRAIAAQSADIESLWVVDSDGRSVVNSVGLAERIDISDRDFFIQAMTSPGTHIAPMILGRRTQNWVVTISRRLEDPDGRARGVIAASIHASSFDRYYQGARINGPLGTHSVLHANGSLIFRSPLPGTEFPVGSFRDTVQRFIGDAGIGTGISSIDGVERLFAWRRFAAYPLMTSSGVAMDDVFAEWRERSLVIAGVTACWVILLSLLAAFALRALRREDALRAQAAEAEAQHRTALESERDAALQARHDKAVLLNELHHRVKNNLQILSSLAMMQKLRAAHLAPEFDSFTARIEAMAKVHQVLSHAQDVGQIEFGAYADALCRDLVRASGRDEITTLVDGNARLSLEIATPLGIILNELLTNILKYSFDGRESGTIRLYIVEGHQVIRIHLADNGIGLTIPSPPPRKSLGLLLIEQLSRQIRATIEVQSEAGRGTSWTITLPQAA